MTMPVATDGPECPGAERPHPAGARPVAATGIVGWCSR